MQNQNQSSVTGAGTALRVTCQCSDPECPHCAGNCPRSAVIAVLRVDMEDRTGTPVCRKCSEDCMESGLFRESVSAFLKYHKPIKVGGAK